MDHVNQPMKSQKYANSQVNNSSVSSRKERTKRNKHPIQNDAMGPGALMEHDC